MTGLELIAIGAVLAYYGHKAKEKKEQEEYDKGWGAWVDYCMDRDDSPIDEDAFLEWGGTKREWDENWGKKD